MTIKRAATCIGLAAGTLLASVAGVGFVSAQADVGGDVYAGDFYWDFSRDITVGPDGSAYVTGYTRPDSGFTPTPGAYDTTPNREDAFVARIDATGRLVYATLLGGSGDETGMAVAVDANGAAYVVGTAYTRDFPTTPGAVDDSYTNPLSESVGFAAKISPDGSSLVYSTRLPGAHYANGVAVDENGNAHIIGAAYPDIVATPGAFDRTYNDPLELGEPVKDDFVATLNATGTRMPYLSLLGGNRDDFAEDIEVDAAGNVYVAGQAGSADFPVTAGAFDTTFNGRWDDAFVTKIAPSGSELVWSTFIGGTGSEEIQDQAFDLGLRPDGSVYLTGRTSSTDFPTTDGALFPQPSGHSWGDGWVLRLDASGSRLIFSTFLPAFLMGAEVDGQGDVHVAGVVPMASFPITEGSQDQGPVLAQLSPQGALVNASHIDQRPWDLAVDAAGSRYVMGPRLTTNTAGTPTTARALATSAPPRAARAVSRHAFLMRHARCTITGTEGRDTLTGTRGPDVLCSGAGNDTVRGLGGHDILRLGPGNDRAWAGAGVDVVLAGPGLDTVTGQTHRDHINGQAGADALTGGDGPDTLTGAGGRDLLNGDNGADEIRGGHGDDTANGGSSADRLAGGPASDRLLGGDHKDRLYGNAGRDGLNGGAARDTCRGHAGRDTTTNC